MRISASIEPLSGSRRYSVPAGSLESHREPCPKVEGFASTPSCISRSTLPASGTVPLGGGLMKIGAGCRDELSPGVPGVAPDGLAPAQSIVEGRTEVVAYRASTSATAASAVAGIQENRV